MCLQCMVISNRRTSIKTSHLFCWGLASAPSTPKLFFHTLSRVMLLFTLRASAIACQSRHQNSKAETLLSPRFAESEDRKKQDRVLPKDLTFERLIALLLDGDSEIVYTKFLCHIFLWHANNPRCPLMAWAPLLPMSLASRLTIFKLRLLLRALAKACHMVNPQPTPYITKPPIIAGKISVWPSPPQRQGCYYPGKAPGCDDSLPTPRPGPANRDRQSQDGLRWPRTSSNCRRHLV